jgi:radical SAM superfamily enzyme YgiQ (UPF0313 family)
VCEDIQLISDNGGTSVRIADGNFLSNKEHSKGILRYMIAHNIQMSLIFECIPTFVDDEIAKLLKEYRELSPKNIVIVGIGLQSTNIESLKTIRRKIKIDHFTRAFQLLEKAGVIIESTMILGLPRETKESFMRGIEYIIDKMRTSSNHFLIYQLMLLPGTDMLKIAEKEGLRVIPGDPRHFVYDTPSMPRSDMLDCLRVVAVAYRIFNTLDDENAKRVRNYYYDSVGDGSHAEALLKLVDYLMDALKDTDFVRQDLKDYEKFIMFKMSEIVSDELLCQAIRRIT